MSWTVWYIQAILRMVGIDAKSLLVRLLSEPEYEEDVAWGMFQLARTDNPSSQAWPRGWPMRSKDFSLIWKARAGETEVHFAEPLRTELARELKNHVQALFSARFAEEQTNAIDWRLRKLAVVLAELDGNASSDLILQILALPDAEAWLHSSWDRIHGLEALLMKGVVPPWAATMSTLEPVVEHVRKHRYDPQQSSLLTHALSIMLFSDDPRSAVARTSQILQENLIPFEGLGQLAKSAGYSRCNDSIILLRELAESQNRARWLGGTWIDAVAAFDTEEARNLLLGFVDPSLPPNPVELIAHNDGKLVARLASMARLHTDVRDRLFALARTILPPSNATLLSKVLAGIGTEESILAALELLNDEGTSAFSYELQKQIEHAFVEHRPYQGSANTFSLVPRSSNNIRARLLEMAKNDPRRRRSAYALLSEIEAWRLEHGRPEGEPRSLTLVEELSWPPEPPN